MKVRVTILASFLASLALAGPPATPEQIEKAVRELGADKYIVREKATEFLWSVGAPAEPYLRKAVLSNDAEVVSRARDLLDKIPFGIAPDSPKKYTMLIARARAADPKGWADIVAELLQEGPSGLDVARQLSEKQEGGDRRAAFLRGIDKEGWRVAPRLIAYGQLDRAEELLARSAAWHGAVNKDDLTHLREYAAVVRLRGSLDANIALWEKRSGGSDGIEGFKSDGTPDAIAAKSVLAMLFKAKGDYAKAQALAEGIGSNNWLETARFDAGAWAQLAELWKPSAAGARIRPAATYMVVTRLAGLGDVADKARTELESIAEESKTDYSEVWAAFRAMMYDRRPDDALAYAEKADTPRVRIPYAEILAQRGRLADGIKLLTEYRPPAPHDAVAAIALVRLLAKSGNREKLREHVTACKPQQYVGTDPRNIGIEFVETLVDLRLEEAACEHAAALIIGGYPIGEAMKRLFPGAPPAAESWYALLRKKSPNQPVLDTLLAIAPLVDHRLASDVHRGKLKEAVEAANSQFAGEKDKLLRGLAEAANAAGLGGEALKILEQADDSAASQLIRGDIHAEAGRWTDAARAYEAASKHEPKQPLTLFLAGFAKARLGDRSTGDDWMLRARVIPLGDETQRIAFCEELAKRFSFGEELRNEVRNQRRLIVDLSSPASPQARTAQFGLLADRRGYSDKLAAADASQRQLVRLSRTNPYFKRNESYLETLHRLYAARALGLLAKGDVAGAIAAAAEAHQTLPISTSLAVEFVPILDTKGNKDEADRIYDNVAQVLDRLVKEFPNSDTYLTNRAWLAARCRRDLSEAVRWAKAAVELAPENPIQWEVLSESQFQNGDKSSAAETVKRGLERQPRSGYLKRLLQRIDAGDPNAALPER